MTVCTIRISFKYKNLFFYSLQGSIMEQDSHSAAVRGCLVIICDFWHCTFLARHIGQLSQASIPLRIVSKWCKCMQHIAQMKWEVIHDVCLLNYSPRNPVTRRSLCTHVNPPPRRYLRLLCLCHVSGVQKFPTAERVSLHSLPTVGFKFQNVLW